MAVTGRKPKPVELRILEGNREHRPIPRTPKVKSVMPPCPGWLNKIAKTEWKRAGSGLFALGLLTREDMVAFASYCENYAILVQCGNHINRKGGYAKYLAGKNSQTSPHLTAMNRAWGNIRAFAVEFGMTPSARGRINLQLGGEDEDEDLD